MGYSIPVAIFYQKFLVDVLGFVEKEALVAGSLSKGDSKYGYSTPPVAGFPVGVREPLNRSGGRKNMFRSATRQESGVIPPS